MCAGSVHQSAATPTLLSVVGASLTSKLVVTPSPSRARSSGMRDVVVDDDAVDGALMRSAGATSSRRARSKSVAVVTCIDCALADGVRACGTAADTGASVADGAACGVDADRVSTSDGTAAAATAADTGVGVIASLSLGTDADEANPFVMRIAAVADAVN
jgi:hypothetical protein